MLKKAAFALAFVLLTFALAAAYVGGMAALTERVVHWLRPGPDFALEHSAGTGWTSYATTEHFAYFVRPGDSIPRWAMLLAEDQLAALDSILEVQFAGSIRFYKHASQPDLAEATGSRSTGVVLLAGDPPEPETHSVHAYDAHEVTHAVVHSLFGAPPAFFDEGLATAYGWDWTPDERDVHLRAVELLAEGRLVEPRRLLANWNFRSYQSYPAYTTAGSFVKYILSAERPGTLIPLLQLDKFSPTEAIEEQLAAVYGKSVDELAQSWRGMLQAIRSPTQMASEDTAHGDRDWLLTGAALFAVTFAVAFALIAAGEKLATRAGGLFRTLFSRHGL
jgi:hypothetical protein